MRQAEQFAEFVTARQTARGGQFEAAESTVAVLAAAAIGVPLALHSGNSS